MVGKSCVVGSQEKIKLCISLPDSLLIEQVVHAPLSAFSPLLMLGRGGWGAAAVWHRGSGARVMRWGGWVGLSCGEIILMASRSGRVLLMLQERVMVSLGPGTMTVIVRSDHWSPIPSIST
jgi:hypothetical protein